jgi:hypothetical protein
MNKNLPRWIMASCRKHFWDRRQGIPIYFEHTGDKVLTDSNGKPIRNYCEFRLDGPYEQQNNRIEFEYDIEINILCLSTLDDKYSDLIEQTLGIMAAAFTNCINVYRYGDGVDDDGTRVGTLILQQEKGERINVNRFGQANAATRILQASVEGHYRMTLIER